MPKKEKQLELVFVFIHKELPASSEKKVSQQTNQLNPIQFLLLHTVPFGFISFPIDFDLNFSIVVYQLC